MIGRFRKEHGAGIWTGYLADSYHRSCHRAWGLIECGSEHLQVAIAERVAVDVVNLSGSSRPTAAGWRCVSKSSAPRITRVRRSANWDDWDIVR